MSDTQWRYVGAFAPNTDPLPAGNMSDAELFHLTGTLPPERIEALLDRMVEIPIEDQIATVDAGLADAAAQYHTAGDLDEFYDKLREAVAEGKEIESILEEIDQYLDGAAEYGIEQLDEVRKVLGL